MHLVIPRGRINSGRKKNKSISLFVNIYISHKFCYFFPVLLVPSRMLFISTLVSKLEIICSVLLVYMPPK